MLRTAAGYIHADPHWWRKILIGGALSLTLIGGLFSAGLVVEQMDNARRGSRRQCRPGSPGRRAR